MGSTLWMAAVLCRGGLEQAKDAQQNHQVEKPRERIWNALHTWMEF
jgi:hypothetical protein